jgi:poly(3-hydroxybutyrate) depolymerase
MKMLTQFLAFLLVLVATTSAHAKTLQNFSCPQDRDIVAGLNKKFKTHRKTDRVFYAEFPDVPKDTPVGVIFSWHGVGDSIENWRNGFALAEHSTNEFPFIVITPHDTGLSPLSGRSGLSWDLFKSQNGDDNLEAVLFENVLGCLARTHNIAADRIYSAGFSGGAIVSNMLHARYPNIVAAVFSGSGTWMSDSKQRDLIHPPFGMRFDMNWTPLNSNDHGAVLMTYGGQDDSYGMLGMEILNFHNAGVAAKAYLPANNRTAVVCEHDGEHHLHPGLRIADVVKFFRAHSAGQPSSYRAVEDLPPAMRSSCTVVTPVF